MTSLGGGNLSSKEKKIINYVKDISKAGLISIGITLISIIIQTFLMIYTSISENILPITNSIIMILSVTIGAIYISLKTKQKGWLNGAIVGLTYMALMVLLNIGLVNDFVLNSYVLIKSGIVLIVGVIGGMIGVNLK
ncbi:putative membrane protein [Gottschalkia acidurici 9a]|uniref:Membrane protein n=1 Tax=Gottschalkia acidurici (strain ATCC 7906 / DSM 604 / BCRC 14475 / CIP 104303 / KCTC 5404 / NCIMB 10678 / 9a) TaxID=1128398 RepID=K0AY91_GOTA9|nr:putative membrane protein [Gottschalkia acidurici 9a]